MTVGHSEQTSGSEFDEESLSTIIETLHYVQGLE